MSYTPSTAREMDGGPVRYMACWSCRAQTLVETLSQYGARCFPCFEAYCAKGGPEIQAGQRIVRPDPARLRAFLRKLADGIRGAQTSQRGWADRLQERHQSGERLTPAQVRAYRYALSGRLVPIEVCDED